MSTPIPSLGNKTPEQLKVAELREELKKRGINVKGLKKDLVERLDEVLRQEVAAATIEVQSEKPSSKDGVVGAEEGAAIDDVGTEPPEMPVTNAELQPEQVEAEVIESAPMAEPEQAIPVEEAISVVESVPMADVTRVAEPIQAADILPPADALPPAEEPVPQVNPEVEGTTVEDGLSNELRVDGEADVPPSDEPSRIVLDETEAVTDGAAESLREAVHESKTEAIEDAGQDGEDSFAVITDDVKAFNEDAKADSGDHKSEPTILSGNSDKPSLESTDTTVHDGRVFQAEADVQADQLKPFRYSGPTSSTDAVIMEASEAEEIPSDKAMASKNVPPVVYADKADMEEGEGSVGEVTTAEPQMETASETMVVETIVTETVVTTETVVETEAEGDLSVAGIEGKISGTLMLLGNEEKEKEEKDEEANEVDGVSKLKDLKPMEIDSDSLTGSKRKDEEESRYQEPTKRQRRWNSEKSAGSAADVSSPKVVTTDTLKDMIPPEILESSTQATLTRSQSTTASSTPKASAPASSEKPASSRTTLPRPDASANGEVDKKRSVPPPTRSPTVSLKIDRFVRPFTIKAVRELLEQTGTVKDMWMDQIKTHCFVTYSSVDEAIATRNAVYHLQWPAAGGKLLIAEFVESEEVSTRVQGLHDKPAATPVTTPRGVTNSASGPGGSSVGLTQGVASIPTGALPAAPAPPTVPRERPALPPKKEMEPPIPTLDDLFKKTRVKPQIYFLPLTEEQVANKLRNKKPSGKPSMRA